jgi:hypothetical protein
MQHLEVSSAVRHIYIYDIRWLRVKLLKNVKFMVHNFPNIYILILSRLIKVSFAPASLDIMPCRRIYVGGIAPLVLKHG